MRNNNGADNITGLLDKPYEDLVRGFPAATSDIYVGIMFLLCRPILLTRFRNYTFTGLRKKSEEKGDRLKQLRELWISELPISRQFKTALISETSRWRSAEYFSLMREQLTTEFENNSDDNDFTKKIDFFYNVHRRLLEHIDGHEKMKELLPYCYDDIDDVRTDKADLLSCFFCLFLCFIVFILTITTTASMLAFLASEIITGILILAVSAGIACLIPAMLACMCLGGCSSYAGTTPEFNADDSGRLAYTRYAERHKEMVATLHPAWQWWHEAGANNALTIDEKYVIAINLMKQSTKQAANASESIKKAWSLSKEAVITYAVNLFNTYQERTSLPKIDKSDYTVYLIRNIMQHPVSFRKLLTALLGSLLINYSDSVTVRCSSTVFQSRSNERSAFLSALLWLQKNLFNPKEGESTTNTETFAGGSLLTDADFKFHFERCFSAPLEGGGVGRDFNIEELAKKDNYTQLVNRILHYMQKFFDLRGEPKSAEELAASISSELEKEAKNIKFNELLATSTLYKARLYFDRETNSKNNQALTNCLNSIAANLSLSEVREKLHNTLCKSWHLLNSQIFSDENISADFKSLYSNWLKASMQLEIKNEDQEDIFTECFSIIQEPLEKNEELDVEFIKTRLDKILRNETTLEPNNEFCKKLLEIMEEPLEIVEMVDDIFLSSI